MINIYHHLGLGDHIICNGLVREIYKKHPQIKLFCKKQNFISVSFMYKDLVNLKIENVNCDDDIILEKNTLKIGFEKILYYIEKENATWDESFYKQCDIDFSKRWSSFYLKRDPISEEKLFRKLNPENKPFCLIHSSGSDGIDRTDKTKINQDLYRIDVKKENTNNIFDYCSLIEFAEEIHCIDSAFKHLVDSFDLNNKLYYHYNINQRSFLNHQSKNRWIII